MFKSHTGLFNDIYCPGLRKTGQCLLPNCIFSHDSPEPSTSNGKREQSLIESLVLEQPIVKKVKSSPSSDNESNVSPAFTTAGSVARQPVKQNSVVSKLYNQQLKKPEPIVAESVKKLDPLDPPVATSSPTPVTSVLPTTNVSVSSVTSDTVTSASQSGPRRTIKDAASLAVQPVTPFAPATHQQRMSYLNTIFKELELMNVRFPKRVAMKLERNIAQSSSKVLYPKNIRKLVVDIRNDKFSKENQAKERFEKRKKEKDLKTRYKEELESLIIPTPLLESNHYAVGLIVPKPVGDDYIASCERCGIRFQPRNRKMQSTCIYHWARLPYDLTTKKRSDVYPCCSERVGESSGCTRLDQHVYKLTELQNLAAVIPFVTTPTASTDKTLYAVGIDCEMAYTTFGTELIRITVVDWDTGLTVLDRTVSPYGEIVDLNTHFSGIADINAGVTLAGTHYPTISFTEARELLFQLVSAQTIVIGHGLENDLNTLRLLHTRVVDTAIRYPTLNEKRKHSLKSLAHTYLGRTIQTGEHDSAEDALAAIDIVKANIKKTIGHVE